MLGYSASMLCRKFPTLDDTIVEYTHSTSISMVNLLSFLKHQNIRIHTIVYRHKRMKLKPTLNFLAEFLSKCTIIC